MTLPYSRIKEDDTYEVSHRVELPSPFVWSGTPPAGYNLAQAQFRSYDETETERALAALTYPDGTDPAVAVCAFRGADPGLFGDGSSAISGRYRVELVVTVPSTDLPDHPDFIQTVEVRTVDVV